MFDIIKLFRNCFASQIKTVGSHYLRLVIDRFGRNHFQLTHPLTPQDERMEQPCLSVTLIEYFAQTHQTHLLESHHLSLKHGTWHVFLLCSHQVRKLDFRSRNRQPRCISFVSNLGS